MHASTVVSTPPDVDPVELPDMKRFARVEIDDDDTLLTTLIKAATISVEAFLHRKLISQSLTIRYDNGFPGEIRPIFAPILSVTSVSYIDTDGATQTLVDGTDYETDINSEPARIRPAFDTSWPTPRNTFNAVTAVVVAGYGTKCDDVPEVIRLAIMQAATDMYENRQSEIVTIGGVVVRLSRTVETMLLPYIFTHH